MNKRRLCCGPGVSRTQEAAARAANAEPWEPMPGMVKRQCPQCRYLFAVPVAAGEDRKLLLPGLQPHSPAGSLSPDVPPGPVMIRGKPVRHQRAWSDLSLSSPPLPLLPYVTLSHRSATKFVGVIYTRITFELAALGQPTCRGRR
jgi:hypothetical protein